MAYTTKRFANKATATFLLCLVSASPLFAAKISGWPTNNHLSALSTGPGGILNYFTNGVAKFNRGTHRCGRIEVPTNCTMILIPVNTTIEGNFYIPHVNDRPDLLIRGANRETSIITGLNTNDFNSAGDFDKPNQKDYSSVYSKQRDGHLVAIERLTSQYPCHFHFIGNSESPMIVDNVEIYSRSHNDDAFGGGDDSMILNSTINVTDANIKIYSENMVVSNCIFYHNTNGAPIQLGGRQLGNPSSSVTLHDITVYDCLASTNDYHHGVITWSGDDQAMVTNEAIRRITFTGSFTHKKLNPTCEKAPFWQFGAGKTEHTEAGRYVDENAEVKTFGTYYWDRDILLKNGSAPRVNHNNTNVTIN